MQAPDRPGEESTSESDAPDETRAVGGPGVTADRTVAPAGDLPGPDATPPPSDPLTAAYARIAELEAGLTAQAERLAGLVRIAANLTRERVPAKAMRSMVNEISALLCADRSTIFVRNRHNPDQLEGLAVQGELDLAMSIEIGRGIAGTVAKRKRAINLKDAYRDPNFDRSFDALTGYQTRSILAVPMLDAKRELVGVVQVLNKREGYFTVEDQALLEALGAQAAITLQAMYLRLDLRNTNADLEDVSQQRKRRVAELEFLYEGERVASDAPDVPALAEGLLRRAAATARCRLAVLLLNGPDHGRTTVYACAADLGQPSQVWTLDAAHPGLLSSLGGTGEAVALREPHLESLKLPRTICGQETPRVRDIVVAPLRDGESTLGMVGLVDRVELNRREDEDDLRLAVLFAGVLGRAVTRIVAAEGARRQDRLMTIGQMLSGVLHDLRGPMAIISGYSQLLAETDDAEERRQMAEAIRRQVAAFNDMTREVLAYATGEQRVFARKVILTRFIAAAEENLRPEFQDRGVGFVVRDHSRGVAHFDEAKMLRVVANIARNARQALGDRGTFTWDIHDLPDGGVEFVLADDGPGIPEKIRENVFDAFTTSGKVDGTGLGLAIVKRIVDDHHGTITVETETGRGTTFRIALPDAPTRPPAAVGAE